MAVALAVAVPLYADGVNYRLLAANLESTAAANQRPSFSFLFHYVGSWHQPLEVDQYAPADAYLRQGFAEMINLPLDGVTRYVASDSLQLHPQGETINRARRLETVRAAFVSSLVEAGALEHIRLVEGELPDPKAGQPIEALASLSLANAAGLQAGNTYLLYRPAQSSADAAQVAVKISGLWTPIDPDEPFWFNPPESFDKKLLVSEQAFFGPIAAGLAKPVNEAIWVAAFDGSPVQSATVPALVRRIAQAQTHLNGLLPYVDLEASPAPALQQYRRDAAALTGLLFVFSVPVLGLAFYFLGLVTAMLVQIQRSEIAVLRSRGASRQWITASYLMEWSLLGLAAIAFGPWAGLAVARWISQTQSFLDFSRPPGLPLHLTPAAAGDGLLVVGVGLLLSLLPVWQAGKHTIVSYKQERARARQRPFWERAYLDLLLLLPALYGLYTLQTQGRLRFFGQTLGSANLFENPALFLLPSLFILALSLLLVRGLPWLLAGLAWASARLPGTVPLLALRQLARSTGSQRGPLLLMVITLSLAGFVASMADTLDHWLVDSAYYEAGADLHLAESGEYTGQMGANGAPKTFTTSGEPAVWNFLPLSDHLGLPGVQAATRVGTFEAELVAGGGSTKGRLIGIDRADFPAVAYFRDDFAGEPVARVLNRLASDPAAILVDRATWEHFQLQVGNPVDLEVRLPTGEKRTAAFKVAGLLNLFPTQYPGDGPFFVANLETIFEACGGLQPYDVWLRTTPGADVGAIVQGINDLGVPVVRVQDARGTVEQSLAAPNRQGILGLLSVGFLAALTLTVVGFFLYALFSFRERFIQLGVLRAVGLSTTQMGTALALEQLLLIAVGLLGGTGIAVLTARLFIPHLPIALGSHPGFPPAVVEIAWGELVRVYLTFGLMVVIGVGATIGSLVRMKIFQAVKLGGAF